MMISRSPSFCVRSAIHIVQHPRIVGSSGSNQPDSYGGMRSCVATRRETLQRADSLCRNHQRYSRERCRLGRFSHAFQSRSVGDND
jgi:hypothetical protein